MCNIRPHIDISLNFNHMDGVYNVSLISLELACASGRHTLCILSTGIKYPTPLLYAHFRLILD